ncbi:hypothetical protein AAHK20_14235 [Trinickia sp. YCB016]
MTDILKISVENQDINLQATKKSLGDFISGLLGQPQTLEKKTESAFSIDHAWLIHLTSLITQRVAQQNVAEPLTFEATIDYRGGLTRKISTLKSFEHFSETQNVVCVSVKLDISLLIQFPGKNSPEKQQVTIVFKTNENKLSFIESFFTKMPIGELNLEIRHTERTWGDDILNLLAKEFELVQTAENKIKKTLRSIFLPFTSLLFPLCFAISMFISNWRTSSPDSIILKKAAALMSSKAVSPDILNEKLNMLLMHAESQIDDQRFGFLSSFLISLGIGAFVAFLGINIAQPAPSFILISKASEKNKVEVEKKLNRRMIGILGSMVLTLILGLAANYLYDKLK